MKYIEDLSYSNLVDIIQGDEKIGANVLDLIAQEMEENNKKIEKLENELSSAKSRTDNLIEGSKRVLQHLEKDTPLAVQRDGYIIVVTKQNISIERNVI